MATAISATAVSSSGTALQKPFKPVQLRVNGSTPSGLKDTIGRLIDGDHNGQPGGNATAALRSGGATIGVRVHRSPGRIPALECSAVDALLEQEELASLMHFGRQGHDRK
jgi:hypothetical protein